MHLAWIDDGMNAHSTGATLPTQAQQDGDDLGIAPAVAEQAALAFRLLAAALHRADESPHPGSNDLLRGPLLAGHLQSLERHVEDLRRRLAEHVLRAETYEALLRSLGTAARAAA